MRILLYRLHVARLLEFVASGRLISAVVIGIVKSA